MCKNIYMLQDANNLPSSKNIITATKIIYLSYSKLGSQRNWNSYCMSSICFEQFKS